MCVFECAGSYLLNIVKINDTYKIECERDEQRFIPVSAEVLFADPVSRIKDASFSDSILCSVAP
jgi:hypothetical protein